MKMLVALIVVLALALAGCGETVIDTTKIEETAKSDLEKKLPQREDLQKELGVSAHETVTAINCPSGQKVETGRTFVCEIVFANGKKAQETFEIIDKEADVHQVGEIEPGSGSNK
jgi:hypothetical protein